MSELPAWPASFDPAQAPVFAHNEIVSARPAGDARGYHRWALHPTTGGGCGS